MTIPSEPLKLEFDTDTLTLDDLALFEAEGFTVTGFKRFMGKYSNWTAKQVGSLTVDELKDVSLQLAAAIKESMVPKAP